MSMSISTTTTTKHSNLVRSMDRRPQLWSPGIDGIVTMMLRWDPPERQTIGDADSFCYYKDKTTTTTFEMATQDARPVAWVSRRAGWMDRSHEM
jgi:hypothetical protein